jgi:GntR family transcriptional regulator
VVAVAYDGQAPKYVRLLETVQDRIRAGTYPLGALLPSESEFLREFDVSRQVVIRALLILEQDGWIRGEQGRGRVVLGVPEQHAGSHGAARLAQAETSIGQVSVKVLSAGPVKAPARIGSALRVKTGAPVVARRRLLLADGVGPVELCTTYVTPATAAGTDIGADGLLLPDGVVAHLRTRRRLVFDQAEEEISARLPTSDEAQLLEIGPRDVLLTLLVTVHDRDGNPHVVLDVAIPATRQVLSDTYPVT